MTVAAASDGNSCCACGAASSLRDFGIASIRICWECGHGVGHNPDNRTFLDHTYADWRVGNGVYFRQLATHRIRHYLDIVGSNPRSAVEIGCATGEAIGILSSMGVECFAADGSEYSIQCARRLYPNVSFSVGLLPQVTHQVDLVMAFHVIEHIEELPQVMHSMRSLLAPSGHVFFCVPNFASLSRRLLGRHWPDLMSEHVQYFTPKSMTVWLDRCGLDVIDTSTQGRSWQWLGGFARALGRSSNASGGHRTGSGSLALLRAADVLMSPMLLAEKVFHVGSELAVIARLRD